MLIQWIFLISMVTLISAIWIPERIVGGHSVPISAVPWQASLLKDGKHCCGAVIYSDQIVLTAGHCISEDDTIITIRVGSSEGNSGGQVVNVSRIEVHESHGTSYSNDIAVIRLQTRLRMGANVSPIPLATSSPRPGSSASVTGWGAIGWNQKVSNSLLETRVNIVDWKSCRKSYGKILTKEMLCAAAPGKDSCSRDSGGPLVSDGKLVGIVSFGKGCANPKYPGVYVDVAKMKSWIYKAIKEVLCLCTERNK
ncbi:trypsin alpha-3-like [Drosophila eugracilis]|uniref:trypsin alpha-3-like n=1 Tax=Drosophila eugracilis TaxID=29029 RepID=UPI001BDA54FB|nr:trypsin alpha-3-like [Drosophila eugracilis]